MLATMDHQQHETENDLKKIKQMLGRSLAKAEELSRSALSLFILVHDTTAA